MARKVYKDSGLPTSCDHIEVCHKQAINRFSADTPIATINDLHNLVALCPNHHWEFDNGLLSL
jgi:predicted restriction endonuclease